MKITIQEQGRKFATHDFKYHRACARCGARWLEEDVNRKRLCPECAAYLEKMAPFWATDLFEDEASGGGPRRLDQYDADKQYDGFGPDEGYYHYGRMNRK